MTIRPIIFSAPMVCALLAGRKTQTRRLASSPLARTEPGDLLYVREAWACHWSTDNQRPSEIDPELWSVRYLADDTIRPAARDGGSALLEQCKRGRPSIHMPRWCSRITLEVHAVTTEPLRAISEADAMAEGVQLKGVWASYRDAFGSLWGVLHDKEGERWGDNPEVVALTFSVLPYNVDKLPAGAIG
jgi:hypothetical protein